MAVDFTEIERAFQAAVAARSERGHTSDDELIGLCNGDAAVAAEVRSLLRHLDAAGGAQERGSDAPAAPDPQRTSVINFLDPAELHGSRQAAGVMNPHEMLEDWGASSVGQRVGEFTLIEMRGSGGMGVVFIAEQERPRRTVALKLVRRQAATPALVRRFEREAQLLGRLNHPGVAQVYAAGVADLVTATESVTRVPYIAMELVDGPNLVDYLKGKPSDPALVLRLVAQVCDAVQHAHLRGVIHRDLKPVNILVASGADGDPQVKVLDFGVARLTNVDSSGSQQGAAAAAATEFTDYGHIVGTLSYMSPEQVRSDREVDARSDVYALGVILFQLLAGELPVDVRSCPLPEAARRIAEHAPAPLGSVNRAFRGDVETIVATALHKDPARRYQSPAELARDLRHHLVGEPIEVRRDSLIYVLAKRGARYRTVALASVALLVVVAVAAGYARTQQKASALAAKIARAAESKATAAQADSERAAARLAAELSASRIDQGRLLGSAGDLDAAERLLWDEHLRQPGGRAAQWALWQLYSRSGCLRTVAAHRGECLALSLAPDGGRFATAGDEHLVRVWSVPQAHQLAELDTGLTTVRAIAFSRDGKRLLAAGDGGALILDVETASRRALDVAGANAHGADFAANDLAVAVGTDDGWVRLFDPVTGGPLTAVAPANPATPVALRAVRFDPSCAHLAAAHENGSVRLWNLRLANGAAVVTPGPRIAGRPGTTGYGVDFCPDGSLLASGSSDRTLTLWRVSDGTAVSTWATKNGSARSAAFSPDGRRVAVPGFWRTQLFDVATGQSALPPRLPALGDGSGFAAAFTPDGQTLIATGPGGTVRLWDLSADPTTVLPSTLSPVRDLAVVRTASTRVIASVQQDGEVRVRTGAADDPGSAAWREVLRHNVGNRAQTLAITSDATRLVIGRADGHVITLDLGDGRVLQDLPAHGEGVNSVRLTKDGQTLVTGSSDDTARLWRWRAEANRWEPAATMPCAGDVIGAAISPDGRSVVTSARPGDLLFWNMSDGRPLGQVSVSAMPWRLAYSPDGRRLAAGSWDRSVQIWDVSAAPQQQQSPPARLAATLLGHTQLVLNEAFDESGELLATVSQDGTLRMWDLADLPSADPAVTPPADRRRCLVSFDAGAGDSLAVAFLPARSPGAYSVAVGYLDGTVRFWDLGYFNRHLEGQAAYQRGLRSGATPWPARGPR
jgi:WD40 repeat protein/serine/threonine protein kinase